MQFSCNNAQTRNALMFAPDADISPYSGPIKAAAEAKGEPKVVKYTNTRLPEHDGTKAGSVSEPASPTQSRIDAAIAGTPCKHHFMPPHSTRSLRRCRPSEITNWRQLLTRPCCSLANAVGIGSDCDETAHDMGHSERHPAYSVPVRRPRRTIARHP